MSESSNKNDNTAMIKQPWFREAYKAAMDFYKIDDQLDSKDRLELSKAYQSITRAELVGGWLGFSSVFLTPFAYKFYKTNAIKGVRVPRNFILGLIAMFGTSQIAGNYMFARQLSNLDPDGTLANRSNYYDEEVSAEHKTNAQRQYEMMRLLNNGAAARWAAYFQMTYHNPARRLPNPADKLNELKHGINTRRGGFMNQRDPIGLYSGPNSEKKKGIPNYNCDRQSENGDGNSSLTNSWESIRREAKAPGSSWDRVRQGGGINGLSMQDGSQHQEKLDDDPFALIDRPSQSEFDQLLEEERTGEDTY